MKSKSVNDSANFDKSVNDKLAISELACEATAACNDSKSKEKIRTSFAQVIVRKIKEKPYFEILYFDSQDKCFHTGFGLFCLEYVFQWLAEEFEIIEGASEMDYGRFQFVEETDHMEKGETISVRERLVELLKTNACPAPYMCDPACRYYGFGDCFPDRFADHLIANGVTVQELGGCKYCEEYTDLPEHFTNFKPVGRVFDTCIQTDESGRWHIEVPSGADIGIKFCPMCGRKLPQPPKGE